MRVFTESGTYLGRIIAILYLECFHIAFDPLKYVLQCRNLAKYSLEIAAGGEAFDLELGTIFCLGCVVIVALFSFYVYYVLSVVKFFSRIRKRKK